MIHFMVKLEPQLIFTWYKSGYIIVLTNRVLITLSKQLETDNRDQKVPLKRVELRSLEGSATMMIDKTLSRECPLRQSISSGNHSSDRDEEFERSTEDKDSSLTRAKYSVAIDIKTDALQS